MALAAGIALPATAASAGSATSGRHAVPVCARASAGHLSCDAYVLAGATGKVLTAGVAQDGYGPSDLQSAYALTAASAAHGTGVTIALVDAYNDKTAAKDLATYRSNYGLPACTIASHCLTIEGQTGTATLPAVDPTGGWELEESLDLDMVSAICPHCHILLVEANSNQNADLGAAENTAAATAGVRAVSNSFGGGEYAGQTSEDSAYYDHPNVAVIASAGDGGYGVEYPASSPYVTAVGGTSLIADDSTRGWSETVWSTSPSEGTGSGCSKYEAKPTWQKDAGCKKRTVADVSADADPNTGAAVYDSTPYDGETLDWLEVGGTSEAAPIIAGVYGLGAALGSGTWTSHIYSHKSGLNDVTTGSTATCRPTYLCTARVGYDGPTGLGTPKGTAAF